MKLFGFEFKRFQDKPSTVNSVEPVEIHRFEDQPMKVEVVELWIVKWRPMKKRYDDWYIVPDLNQLAFTDKQAAEEYAEQLRKAIRLLGDSKSREVWVDRQNNPTNV